jgi:hypothetical protein
VVLAVALAALYPAIVALSRLYLGLHSPDDVTGGAVLGLALITISVTALGDFDRWLTQSSMLEFFSFVIGGVALFGVVHPQPRPATVTFAHDMEMASLTMSCALGNWIHMNGGARTLLMAALPQGPMAGEWVSLSVGDWAIAPVRVVSGFMLTGIAYLLIKEVSSLLLLLLLRVDVKAIKLALEQGDAEDDDAASHRSLALQVENRVRSLLTKEQAEELEVALPADVPRTESDAKEKSEGATMAETFGVSWSEVPIQIIPKEPWSKGVELGAVAASKMMTFGFVGMTITGLVPALHGALGLNPLEYR